MAIKDIIAKTQRVDAAARRERLQSPEIIQKTKAVRHPIAISDGLIGWWDFVGNVALDLSGNGNNGTFYNGVSALGDTLQISSDGGNNYVSYGVSNILMPASITISLWFRRHSHLFAASKLLWGTVASETSGGRYRGIQIFELNHKIFGVVIAGGYEKILYAGTVPDHWWTHAVLTYDGFDSVNHNFKMYLNGILMASWGCQWGPLQYLTIQDIRSGVCQSGYSFWGRIDNIKIFNRALQPYEIHKLYGERNYRNLHTGNAQIDGVDEANIGSSPTGKVGFYGHGGIVRPDSVADASTQDLTGDDTVSKTKTEADLTSCKDAINTIIDRLQELGLIA